MLILVKVAVLIGETSYIHDNTRLIMFCRKCLGAFLFAVCVFSIATSFAQERMPKYFYLINRADSLSKTENLIEAEKSYLKALKILDSDPEASLSAASVSLRLAEVNRANERLRKAIQNGADKNMIASDGILSKYFDKNYKLQQDFPKMRSIYFSKIKNEDERVSLLSMVGTDQTLRSLLGTLDFKKVDSLIHVNDTLNMATFKGIINKIGFPDRDKVGKDGVDAAFIIMMHTFNDGSNDDRDIIQIEPLMKRAVLHGKFPPYYLAIAIDRNKGLKRQKQTYGTYWEITEKVAKDLFHQLRILTK